ncbi:MAG: glycoside hydrolase family 13 protein [Clostridia bacterium]|nr:glycoside hydrolase family 13 protein [Clostridia bacterium]
MKIFHDSRSGIYRFPTGAVTCGQNVSLRVRAVGVKKAVLRVWWDNSEELHDMQPIGGDLYTVDLTMPDTPGLFWYYFRFEDENGAIRYYGNAADGLGGVGELMSKQPESYQITVYDAAFRTPEWMRNGNMMQIMVDRFNASQTPDPLTLPIGSFYHMRWDEDPVLVCNDRTGEYAANDFFGGDLKGVEQKLDYLKDMGVTVLYFNPIFKARSNHKYNTGDYMTIDPGFGTEDDFRHLCAAAKERGMRIVLDGVFSHTGSDSLYFNKNGSYGDGGAYNDPKSPYAAWFNFKKWPDDYTSWWGFKTLPTVNKDDPSFRKFIISGRNSVVAHWIRAGSSGWRLDVADELPMDFIAEIRARQKKINPDSALIGEVWEDPSNKVAYGKMRCYCLGDTLDATMNYPLRDAILLFMRCRIDAAGFVRRVESIQENLPAPFLYSQMNLLSSHDKPRALSVLADIGDMEPERRFRRAFDMNADDYARGKRRLIAAWKLICALPGMPCVYYGDEAGLYGMSDPMCRGTYPWGHEDRELLREFRDAMHRRQDSAALRTGSMKLAVCGPDVVMVCREIHDGKDVFGKAAANETCALAINRARESRWVEYDGHSFEVPAESAVWLVHDEPKPKPRRGRAKAEK